MDDVPVFRASKKRKSTRQKETSGEDVIEIETQGQDLLLPTRGSDDASEDVNIANLLKLRKQNKARGGVQFSNSRNTRADEDDSSSSALVKADPSEETLKNISSRFVGSTGQVVDVDKHMMAYIDSEIAKRRAANALQVSKSTTHDMAEDEDYTSSDSDDKHSATANMHHRAMSSGTTAPTYATQNPLSEFDLGPQAHSTNLERTTLAIARAQSGLPLSGPDPEQAPRPRRRPRKPRLGPDGKPYRPRPRKRRNSSDIARDALVEQVLHENRLEGVYANTTNNPSSSSVTTITNPTLNNNPQSASPNKTQTDEAADEKLAAQFKQEFMDAMAERRQQRQNQNASSHAAAAAAKAAKAVKGGGAESVFVHGPKLGGSRSARAKMVAALQQQQQQQQQQQSKG